MTTVPMTLDITLSQINLQHSKSATALLCSRHAKLRTNPHIILIQEPWVFNGRVCGLGSIKWGSALYCEGEVRPRSCMIIPKAVDCITLRQFCCQDLMAVKIKYRQAGREVETIIVSAYLPYDSIMPPPTKELMAVVRYAESMKLGLIVGCDANSQHTIWGSSKCNFRGNKLMDFILSSRLTIQNVGTSPTFVTSRRQEVIDLTLTNKTVTDRITKWRVLEDDSLSDHRYIEFRLAAETDSTPAGRNPRKADWTRFGDLVEERIRVVPILRRIAEIEEASNSLGRILIECYETVCPERRSRQGKVVPWWNAELTKLRKSSRRLQNRARKTGLEADWFAYGELQKEYKRKVKSAKLDSYRKFCSELEDQRGTARLCKVLQKNRTVKLDALLQPDGSYTNSRSEINDILFATHFPGCKVVDSRGDINSEKRSNAATKRLDWFIASRIVTDETMRFAFSSFDDFKSPGPDGIYPVMLKRGGIKLMKVLKRIFTACLAHGYIPRLWREVKVVFVPKPGKDDYALAKSFRPISLTSFLLKGLERMVEKRIRLEILSRNPLSSCQHAYQSGKSCESALHDCVRIVEEGLEAREYTMGVFVDIEGAFDNATFGSMCTSARNHGVEEVVVRWIHAMLSKRLLTTEGENNDSVRVEVEKGCPQGGVLSPLLWCFVVDSLLNELQDSGCHIQAYADDVCALISGRSLATICSKMQIVLDKIENWCNLQGLSVNPNKSTLVLFTRKRKMEGLTLPAIKGVTLQLSSEVKYLGVTLDNKLSWKTHVEQKVSRTLKVFWQCKGAFSKTWGLRPAVVYWIYTTLIRPIVTYASVVWWKATLVKSIMASLARLQRSVCLGITGAMSTTSGDALNALLNLLPLDLQIRKEAMKSAYRLSTSGVWNTGANIGHRQIYRLMLEQCPLFSMPGDGRVPCTSFGRKYDVSVPERDQWLNPEILLRGLHYVFYTDGSKTLEGTGSGWYLDNETKFTFATGQFATVFLTEVYAILNVACWIIENRWKGRSIGICSDSQAALKAIANPVSSSKLVSECKLKLNSVAKRNRLTLMWVPGHCGVDGNELADELANLGSATKPLGPEPILGISSATLIHWINDYVNNVHTRRWTELSSCKTARRFVKQPSREIATFLLKLKRKDLRSMLGVITGHTTCGQHMTTLGVITDPTCQFCLEEDDTIEHYLCNCPAFARIRLRRLGSDVSSMNNVHTLPLPDLLGFINETKRFEEE